MVRNPVPITANGKARLQAELATLRDVRRQEVADRIRRVRAESRPQNDAEYEDAKREQSLVEGRINELDALLANTVLIEHNGATSDGCIRLGSTVTVCSMAGKDSDYTIVGRAEAKPLGGMISNESPVGRALLGKRIGDEVLVDAPAGTIKLVVKHIA
ncbi:MAG: transcription elongation factor GreA [Dehalococcoidia bacterium]